MDHDGKDRRFGNRLTELTQVLARSERLGRDRMLGLSKPCCILEQLRRATALQEASTI